MIFIASVAESFVPLQNIGLLAILATATSMIVLPFISTVISKKTALNGHLILGWLMLCTGIAGIIFLKSRTSLLMSMATLAMFQIGVNRFKTCSKLLITVGILISLPVLWFYKQGSSLGRLQILEIVFSQLSPNDVSFFCGIGNFQSWYNPAQARYFAQNSINNEKALLADNTFFLFNDILQLSIEKGILLGLLILGLAIVYLVKVVRCLRSKNYTSLVLGAHFCIISLFASSLFYYTFQVWITYVLMIICILILLPGNRWRLMRFPIMRYSIFFLVVAVCLALGTFFYYGVEYSRTATHAETLSRNGFLLKADSLYETLKNDRFADGKLLFSYAFNLYCLNKLDAALVTINKSASYFYSDETAVLKAQIYNKKNDPKNAEQFFTQAVYINPKSFRNRLLLVDFYIDRKDTVKAEYWAKETLLLPEKIVSTRSASIKSYICKVLIRLSNPEVIVPEQIPSLASPPNSQTQSQTYAPGW